MHKCILPATTDRIPPIPPTVDGFGGYLPCDQHHPPSFALIAVKSLCLTGGYLRVGSWRIGHTL